MFQLESYLDNIASKMLTNIDSWDLRVPTLVSSEALGADYNLPLPSVTSQQQNCVAIPQIFFFSIFIQVDLQGSFQKDVYFC